MNNYSKIKKVTDMLIVNFEIHAYDIDDAKKLLNIYLTDEEQSIATWILINAKCVNMYDEMKYKAANLHLYYSLELIDMLVTNYYHWAVDQLYKSEGWVDLLYTKICELPLNKEQIECLYFMTCWC